MRKALLFIFLLTLSAFAEAQQGYVPPMDIPLLLSGNFGELRRSHFHSGLDIKTNGAEGVPVYAVQDGYVSRIKVSPYGYGKALYIDHPDGFTSVYAHLRSYNDTITHFLRDAQYALESFSVDLIPGPDRIPVIKGELIGYSGNSGSSGGPHLHFELRETETERPVNPLVLNYPITDTAPPILKSVRLYPLGDSSLVEGRKDDRLFPTSVTQGNCKLKYGSSIKVFGSIGVAFEGHDQLSGTSNYCGVYKAELHLNDKLVYEYAFDKLDFSQRRLIHAHRDYGLHRSDKTSYQRTFVLPNNDLIIYGKLEKRGVLHFERPGTYQVRLTLYDYKGNKSQLNFAVEAVAQPQRDDRPGLSRYSGDERVLQLKAHEDNQFEDMGGRASIPAGHLFEDSYGPFHREDTIPGAWSRIYHFGDPNVPLYKPMSIGLKARRMPDELKNSALLVRVSGSRRSAVNARWNGDWLEAEVDEFGRYAIMVDTVAPVVNPYDFKRSMKGFKDFSFKVADDLAGIESVNGWIDGKWCLLDFDAKTAKVTYTFDRSRVLPGKHKFRIVVKDGVGNEGVYESEFEF